MIKPRRIVLVVVVFICSLLYLQMKPYENTPSIFWRYHGERGASLDSLYEGENAMFASAGKCDHCHGKDPNGIASTDFFGNDVNVVDDWSSSMMALSAKDPYWRAKVSEEVLFNPAHQEELENLCTKCHAPLGNYASQSLGNPHYSIASMIDDPVALDGVSCLACHRQNPQPQVASHTGQLFFNENKIAFGPFTSPLITPMALSSQYTPEFGPHINDSKLCAGCHSLITQTVDLSGTPTGGEFVEQATWHEWLNSAYPLEGVSCQSCHLPRLPKQSVILAAGFNTPPREPFGLHELTGGNAFMLELMKDNKEALGIASSIENFDETILKTVDMLQNRSIDAVVDLEDRDQDTLRFSLFLRNLTGHKMPSGYPARKMSVHVQVLNDMNEVIFTSGGFDEDYHVIGEDATWEPHHTVIRSAEEVQIYEMVMGDVNGQRTTLLERGAIHLKDNRLVPRGFSTTSPLYDTTVVVLNIEDPDFNSPESGTDRIFYNAATNGYNGPVQIQVSVYYQSVPPNWVEGMFENETSEIDAFEQMYHDADKSPVLMKEIALNVDAYVNVEDLLSQSNTMQWFGKESILRINSKDNGFMQIFDVSGKLIETIYITAGPNVHSVKVSNGTYIAVLNSGKEKKVLKFVK